MEYILIYRLSQTISLPLSVSLSQLGDFCRSWHSFCRLIIFFGGFSQNVCKLSNIFCGLWNIFFRLSNTFANKAMILQIMKYFCRIIQKKYFQNLLIHLSISFPLPLYPFLSPFFPNFWKIKQHFYRLRHFVWWIWQIFTFFIVVDYAILSAY